MMAEESTHFADCDVLILTLHVLCTSAANVQWLLYLSTLGNAKCAPYFVGTFQLVTV